MKRKSWKRILCDTSLGVLLLDIELCFLYYRIFRTSAPLLASMSQVLSSRRRRGRYRQLPTPLSVSISCDITIDHRNDNGSYNYVCSDYYHNITTNGSLKSVEDLVSSTLRFFSATVAVFRADMNGRLTESETWEGDGLDKISKMVLIKPRLHTSPALQRHGLDI